MTCSSSRIRFTR